VARGDARGVRPASAPARPAQPTRGADRRHRPARRPDRPARRLERRPLVRRGRLAGRLLERLEGPGSGATVLDHDRPGRESKASGPGGINRRG
jgi:hypothetical protein